MNSINPNYILLVLSAACIYSAIAGGAPQTDGFFFFGAAGGISPARVASVMQSKLQNFLGKDVTVRPFVEQERRPIKCDKNLDCDFKNRTCRWHNVKNDAGPSYIKDIYVGGGKPNKTGVGLLKSFVFGTDDLPNGQYGLVATTQINATRILFCSDPVPFKKQEPDSKGILKLKSWMMAKTQIKACIRIWDKYNVENDKKNTNRKWPINWLGCSKDVSYGENTGPNKLTINLADSYKAMKSLAAKYKKPTSATNGVTYEVCLLIGPFPSKKGGLAFIDDISWDSGFCERNSGK